MTESCSACASYKLSADHCANWSVKRRVRQVKWDLLLGSFAGVEEVSCVDCKPARHCSDRKDTPTCTPFGQYKVCREGGKGEKLCWEAKSEHGETIEITPIEFPDATLRLNEMLRQVRRAIRP